MFMEVSKVQVPIVMTMKMAVLCDAVPYSHYPEPH
jgi:hypothetical protein